MNNNRHRNKKEAEIRLRMVKDDLAVIRARELRLEAEKFNLLMKLVALKDSLNGG